MLYIRTILFFGPCLFCCIRCRDWILIRHIFNNSLYSTIFDTLQNRKKMTILLFPFNQKMPVFEKSFLLSFLAIKMRRWCCWNIKVGWLQSRNFISSFFYKTFENIRFWGQKTELYRATLNYQEIDCGMKHLIFNTVVPPNSRDS